MHCFRAYDLCYYTAPWVIKAISPSTHTHILSSVIFFIFTHICQLSCWCKHKSITQVLKIIIIFQCWHSKKKNTIIWKLPSATLYAQGIIKKQLTMKLSPLHYMQRCPKGFRKMRSSRWSQSSFLNGEGTHTIPAYYVALLTRRPSIFWNLLVRSVINKAVGFRKYVSGKTTLQVFLYSLFLDLFFSECDCKLHHVLMN